MEGSSILSVQSPSIEAIAPFSQKSCSPLAARWSVTRGSPSERQVTTLRQLRQSENFEIFANGSLREHKAQSLLVEELPQALKNIWEHRDEALLPFMEGGP
jgi:hypothetical protein